MKLTTCLTALLAALTLGAGATAVQADELAKIKENKSITIGIDLGQAPFGMVDGQMKQVGSDVAAAELLAKDLGVELKVVSVSPANRIPYLMTNKVDAVIASFSITDERKKTVDFSAPYAVIQSAVSTTAGLKVNSLKDIEGKEVAVTRGSTNDQIITKAVTDEDLKDVTIVRYDDNATATNAVVSGQQSVYVVAPSLLAPVNAANPSKKIEPQLTLKTFPLGIGLRKNEDTFKGYLDNWVQENLANGKLREIYKTYHNVDLPADMTNIN
ncbi:transporter substrate-binding domain-containing protein [Brucella thiophenivorans]|uniref:NMT1/THI5 like family protein n=1 Tax=Brucella thiophenivorans TaxID=571255 RepID=A0A256FA11_9HYPH|nr:transporter substrate-binding domain-containing protein [Brucella thiophenivorans]OYR11695.1 NMT1/THI5 like family protein [Brucella thiophenivorans]